MPKFHNDKRLKNLLLENDVPLNDAVRRGKFYSEYFDWCYLCKVYKMTHSIKSICEITGLSYDAVRTNLIKSGCALEKFSRKNKSKYSFDNSLFFPNPTFSGSYVLGWMYSDGSITKNKLSLTLKKDDEKQLNYISNLISNKKIRNIKNSNAVSFEFYSVEIAKKFIVEYNLIPDKSHHNFIIPIYKFSDENFPYLLLGLLEGDGNISKKYPSVTLLLSSNSWNNISTRLMHIGIDFSNVSCKVLNKYGLVCVDFRGNSYFSILYFIYKNTNKIKPLLRKYELFLSQLDRSISGKTSPYKSIAYNIRDSLTYNV